MPSNKCHAVTLTTTHRRWWKTIANNLGVVDATWGLYQLVADHMHVRPDEVEKKDEILWDMMIHARYVCR